MAEPITRRKRPIDSPTTKVALVASSGGHLYELLCMRGLWEGKRDRFWVSFPTKDAESLLAGERVYWAAYPTTRSIKNLVKNLLLAWRTLRSERPDMILSTGAGVAVPFLVLGRLLGIRTVYVESITRITELSLSGHMVYPFVDRVL
ncbi:MAG: hypothetical protein ACYS99_21575, partial [Planctomycetota bacterium]